MPKFTVEVDSDTHEAKFFIDNQEYPAEEFSIGRYVCKEYPIGDEITSRSYIDTYVSMTSIQGSERFTRSIQFRDGEEGFYHEASTQTSPLREMAKVISRHIASSKLSDALTKMISKK
jgi:hypothetical protein